jgi:hypothetical protein
MAFQHDSVEGKRLVVLATSSPSDFHFLVITTYVVVRYVVIFVADLLDRS